MKALALLAACLLLPVAASASISPDLQARLDAKLKVFTTWAADPAIVAAVRAHNATLPADQLALTQEKWTGLSLLDPLVRQLAGNPAAQILRARKTELITEAFVSDAAGCKVAFLSKPTNWCHQGKPKHDVPMSGKTWIGEFEIDKSTGRQQLQVAVPILDGDVPIGSLVVGLDPLTLSRSN